MGCSFFLLHKETTGRHQHSSATRRKINSLLCLCLWGRRVGQASACLYLSPLPDAEHTIGVQAHKAQVLQLGGKGDDGGKPGEGVPGRIVAQAVVPASHPAGQQDRDPCYCCCCDIHTFTGATPFAGHSQTRDRSRKLAGSRGQADKVRWLGSTGSQAECMLS